MNNNIVKGSLFFITGAAIASFVTYKVVEKKFKKIADAEIESVKEMYERKLKKTETSDIKSDKQNKKKVQTNVINKTNPYSSLVNDLGYANKKENEEEKEDMNTYSNIEVIPPEEYGEVDYKRESLTYYADKVLAYESGEIIVEVDKLIGPNSLNTFGEYEDDSVFVRNHVRRIDFEILLDNRNYFDVYSMPDLDDDAGTEV